ESMRPVSFGSALEVIARSDSSNVHAPARKSTVVQMILNRAYGGSFRRRPHNEQELLIRAAERLGLNVTLVGELLPSPEASESCRVTRATSEFDGLTLLTHGIAVIDVPKPLTELPQLIDPRFWKCGDLFLETFQVDDDGTREGKRHPDNDPPRGYDWTNK